MRNGGFDWRATASPPITWPSPPERPVPWPIASAPSPAPRAPTATADASASSSPSCRRSPTRCRPTAWRAGRSWASSCPPRCWWAATATATASPSPSPRSGATSTRRSFSSPCPATCWWGWRCPRAPESTTCRSATATSSCARWPARASCTRGESRIPALLRVRAHRARGLGADRHARPFVLAYRATAHQSGRRPYDANGNPGPARDGSEAPRWSHRFSARSPGSGGLRLPRESGGATGLL